MWDFDEMTLSQVRAELQYIQDEYALPNIYIEQGSSNMKHIARCFTNLPWQDARLIICATQGVDEAFVRMSIMRGYFALRCTPKNGLMPVLVDIIYSRIPENDAAKIPYEMILYEARSK